ncbi:MAG: hypothetical protein ACOYLB_06750 [Phototrophicaceae bacterium]
MPSIKEREELAQFLAEANFATESEKVAWLHTLLDTPHPADASVDAQRVAVVQQLEQLAEQQRQLQRRYRFLLAGTFIWVVCMVILLATRLGWLA